VGERPILAVEAGKILIGQTPNHQVYEAAANASLKEIDPGTDIHATAEYRRYVAAGLVKQALAASVDAAQRGGKP
jgi:carbon-monoxide dehydrogenase medium subunit